eukprot:CAMPEP_0179944218 /NCGR_PEP_ID=MMETSP0983-20121128/18850_1 /TAXON_ID=483367 /ORGANISM="non described non described, Strain CCMP 2436" /LENGTH=155 /DNA_ID=CAMNT_0021852207 /DNA_START=152 /DNA_END=617 /DNA_ORIENTATION=-
MAARREPARILLSGGRHAEVAQPVYERRVLDRAARGYLVDQLDGQRHAVAAQLLGELDGVDHAAAHAVGAHARLMQREERIGADGGRGVWRNHGRARRGNWQLPAPHGRGREGSPEGARPVVERIGHLDLEDAGTHLASAAPCAVAPRRLTRAEG